MVREQGLKIEALRLDARSQGQDHAAESERPQYVRESERQCAEGCAGHVYVRAVRDQILQDCLERDSASLPQRDLPFTSNVALQPKAP